MRVTTGPGLFRAVGAGGVSRLGLADAVHRLSTSFYQPQQRPGAAVVGGGAHVPHHATQLRLTHG